MRKENEKGSNRGDWQRQRGGLTKGIYGESRRRVVSSAVGVKGQKETETGRRR